MLLRRHKYKFTDKHNSRGGIAAFLLGILSSILFVCSLYMAYRDRGSSGTLMGIIGTAAFGISTIGLLTGLSSFKEEDRFYLFSWLGTILSGVMWILICAVIAIGFWA